MSNHDIERFSDKLDRIKNTLYGSNYPGDRGDVKEAVDEVIDLFKDVLQAMKPDSTRQ